MSDTRGVLIIGDDAVLKGSVSNSRRIEVHGYVEGEVEAGEVMIAEGGRVYGTVKANAAEVRGTLQGGVRVKELIAIRDTGSVSGNVKYGRLAMDEGAELSATVRNIPPTITGDLDLAVTRGGLVRVTLADINAVDPDDKPENLSFEVSNAANGNVVLAAATRQPVASFTQADLENGRVLFVHDGGPSAEAQFDITVTDASGATSGRPQTVHVAIRG